MSAVIEARHIEVRGIVQGVGFRPFVFRLAREHGLTGWVLNQEGGVRIHLEGAPSALSSFVRELPAQAPSAARIAEVKVEQTAARGYAGFEILTSHKAGRPTVPVSPDLAVCADCLHELFDPANRRHLYPYINCTHCGPRYSVVTALPYDRPNTTLQAWPMCPDCAREYHDPLDRRFHAQPTACPVCGPGYYLQGVGEGKSLEGAQGPEARGQQAVEQTAALLQDGKIVAIKGIGGYHLACDAQNPRAVEALRERKFRKEKPFALMVDSLETARDLLELTADAEALLTSAARPIVLVPARTPSPLITQSAWGGSGVVSAVAPDTAELGVMLPYTPLHHLLFAAGAPRVLVLTSANRSSEPIAYRDGEALEQLAGIADAFLVGERPIARRVDDSIARASPFGAQILRRSRGYAPSSLARLPAARPILAAGADLKNSLTLVVGGEALGGGHIGDLDHLGAFHAFEQTARDLLRMYELEEADLTVVHDLHPQYRSTGWAQSLAASSHLAVQHHQAHVASVLAEHGFWDRQVLGIAWDGTGYGEDGAIWGGEAFVGGLESGFRRVGHLEYASLVGGDAAAQHPVQAAVGFLRGLAVDFSRPPFNFPPRFAEAERMLEKNLRVFPTSSVGRLFDCAAALLGFTRAVSYEGQAAAWLEHQALQSRSAEAFAFGFGNGVWRYRELLEAVIEARLAGKPVAEVARGFIGGLALGLWRAAEQLCETHTLDAVALSGGVFQNGLLLRELAALSRTSRLRVLVNRQAPPNDGGISLGQAALVALRQG
ncbi:MAG: carbamoyltransferase HypF [Meiothermus sp.]|nr:carbamoyltransferase HypF [Meiothermus sp.]